MAEPTRRKGVAYGLRAPERAAAATVLDLIEPADDLAFADAVFTHPDAWVLYGVGLFGRIATGQFAPIDQLQRRSVLVVHRYPEAPPADDAYLITDVLTAYGHRVPVVLDLGFPLPLAYLAGTVNAPVGDATGAAT